VNIFEARRVKYQAIRNSISFVVEKCFDEFNFLNIVGYVTYTLMTYATMLMFSFKNENNIVENV
jgi:hypothetical protein